jgi:hypothetical protein
MIAPRLMMSTSPRFLHVANGGSTTGTIAAANIPGKLSIWADSLYDGKVPAGDDEAVLAARAEFHSGPEHSASEVADGLRQWRSVIADGDYDELVLWYEHDLFDQLNLIQLLSWIRHHPVADKRISLVCIGSFPGRPAFKGLGELTPQELAPLLDTRLPLTAEQYDVAERAWNAYRAPTPEPLERLLQTDTSPLPFLAAALRRFLEEYPWTTDGLSRFERRLLGLLSGGPIALMSAFPRMQEGETAYYMTDSSLDDLVTALATTSPPLVAADKPGPSGPKPLQRTAALTEAGREVLSGGQDRISLCGIDKWLGGVHLTDAGPIWRWNPDRGQIVKS